MTLNFPDSLLATGTPRPAAAADHAQYLARLWRRQRLRHPWTWPAHCRPQNLDSQERVCTPLPAAKCYITGIGIVLPGMIGNDAICSIGSPLRGRSRLA